MYDKDHDGILSVQKLGVVLRAVGHNPTEIEIQEMIDEIDSEGTKETIHYIDEMLLRCYYLYKMIKLIKIILRSAILSRGHSSPLLLKVY